MLDESTRTALLSHLDDWVTQKAALRKSLQERRDQKADELADLDRQIATIDGEAPMYDTMRRSLQTSANGGVTHMDENESTVEVEETKNVRAAEESQPVDGTTPDPSTKRRADEHPSQRPQRRRRSTPVKRNTETPMWVQIRDVMAAEGIREWSPAQLIDLLVDPKLDKAALDAEKNRVSQALRRPPGNQLWVKIRDGVYQPTPKLWESMTESS
jgi:hypothetical protein